MSSFKKVKIKKIITIKINVVYFGWTLCKTNFTYQ